MDGDGDEDEEPSFDLYESPCVFDVSNDAFTTEKIDSFEPCDMDFYGGCDYEDISDIQPFVGADGPEDVAGLEAGGGAGGARGDRDVADPHQE